MLSVGTRTVLLGVHHPLIHSFFVTKAWHQIHGSWPSWREMVCIIVHDWGYFGKPNLDGTEGQSHPFLGAGIAGRLFGQSYYNLCLYHSGTVVALVNKPNSIPDIDRGRFMPKSAEPSPLWAPDKLSILLYPKSLYLFLARLSGEMAYYKRDLCLPRCGKGFSTDDEWYDCMAESLRERVAKAHPAPGMIHDVV